jgi:hypothetical protein
VSIALLKDDPKLAERLDKIIMVVLVDPLSK